MPLLIRLNISVSLHRVRNLKICVIYSPFIVRYYYYRATIKISCPFFFFLFIQKYNNRKTERSLNCVIYRDRMKLFKDMQQYENLKIQGSL